MLFVCFGLIVAVVFGAMTRGSNYEEERGKARAEKLKTARAEWTKAAETYGWVDQAKGVARIPVTRAMELTLADLQAKKPTMAGPIATPQPAAPPVTATGAAQPNNPPLTAPAAMSPTPPPVSVEGPNSEIRGQPTGAANPPNAAPGTQPGPGVTPAAAPNSHSEIPAASPRIRPIQHPVGTPLPVSGRTPAPRPSP